jgi:hypothetical protein
VAPRTTSIEVTTNAALAPQDHEDNMATIESKDIVKALLQNDGVYEGDPQALFVSICMMKEGKTLYHVAYSSSEMMSLYSSPFVSEFHILWQRQLGLSSFGWELLHRI